MAIGLTEIDFTGTAAGVSVFGTDLKIVITGFGRNRWTGDTGPVTAVLMAVENPAYGPCQAYVMQGEATATLPIPPI